MAIQRVNLSLPSEVVEIADRVASSLHISRSAFVSMAITQQANAFTFMDKLPELLDSVKALQALAAQSSETVEHSAAADRAELGASLPIGKQES